MTTLLYVAIGLAALGIPAAKTGITKVAHASKAVVTHSAHATKTAALKSGTAVKKVFWHKPLRVTTK